MRDFLGVEMKGDTILSERKRKKCKNIKSEENKVTDG